ncbi:MAG: diguanylate cyclase [Magnetococcales bacterium]|nr:diguanylate cyclase [Magnetococcales bacterium]MBF0322067.1 diguanylate cyclase [Magnetococcales bacterium]
MAPPFEVEKILLLEDSRLLASTLKREMEKHISCQVTTVATFQEAKSLVHQPAHGFTLAVLDLTLPDATQEEIVEFFRGLSIPCIVMTSRFDEALREYVFAKGVIDFVLKDGPASLEYLFSLLMRLHRNREVQILIVDDSRSAREHMKRLLHKHHFQVLEAQDGVEALSILNQHDTINLVVTDYTMPNMDGYELTRQIRQKWGKDQLAVLGISSVGAHVLSARFLKIGANDFLGKPFLEEEFTCRVTRNVENLERIRALEEAAVRDVLTGLHNRRFLRDVGTQMFSSVQRGKLTLCAAILDVDFFKKVNDTYGHDAGDAVLRTMGGILRRHFSNKDIVARAGGEEFCILVANQPESALQQLFENLRTIIQKTTITHQGVAIPITVSIGVSIHKTDTLDELINQADAALYTAKQNGRNRVIFHTPEAPTSKESTT